MTQDSRVTGGINWMLATVGLGIVTAMGWVAVSINDLNRTVASLAATNSAVLQRVADLEERTRYLERKQRE